MSQEIFELVQRMDLNDIETQLALQCAPLIAGLKISNLLIVQHENVSKVKQILSNTEISYCILLTTEQKTTLLLYKSYQLELYFSDKRVRKMFRNLGYQKFAMESLLQIIRYAMKITKQAVSTFRMRWTCF